MKKISTLISMFFLIFLLGGCTNTSIDAERNIVSPENRQIPLQGKWEVTEDIEKRNGIAFFDETDKWSGKVLQFSGKAVQFGDYYWGEVNYRTRMVKTEEYILYKNEYAFQELHIDDEEILVITVSSRDNYIGEFISLDKDRVIGFIQNEYFYLKKVSDRVDKGFEEYAEKNLNTEGEDIDRYIRGSGKSGVLLGLRAPNEGSDSGYSYRTLWIAVEKGKLHPVLGTEDIIFPRLSGFWRLKVDRIGQEDIITAGEISEDRNTISDNPDHSQENNEHGSIHRIIEYVSNDYLALEVKTRDSSTELEDSRLQLQMVDNISRHGGIGISDIMGERGVTALKNSRDSFIKGLGLKSPAIEIDNPDDEKNIGLMRRSGHWFLRGRIVIKGDKEAYRDYVVNIIPPSNLVIFDTLYVTWTAIKDRVPEAIDAYTSPGRDIALIFTKSRLYIYPIEGDNLGKEPLFKTDLREGETPIMAEWAQGNYVENWEKIFMRNQTETVNGIK